MTTTAINLPLYRVLKALDVPDADAEAAAHVGPPDLSHLATKDELRAEIAGVRGDIITLRSEMKAEIAGVRTEIASLETRLTRAIQQQTTWLFGALIAAVGVLIAVQRLVPPPPSPDTARPAQVAPAPAAPPRAEPRP